MTLSDRLLGLLGGGMVIAAIALLVFGGESDTGAAAGSAAPPPIELIEPADGAVVAGPVEVVFRVPGGLTRLPGGWGTGDHHLHLLIGGIEVMPSGSDLERTAAGEYRWRIGRLDPGQHEMLLLWSGPDHRQVRGTESDRVRVTAR